MSLLGGLLVSQCRQLTGKLAEFVSSLVARPSQLPDFVAYVEVIWPHLDPMSAARQAIASDLEHLSRLHVIYDQSAPNARPGSPTLYHPLYGAATFAHGESSDEEQEEEHTVTGGGGEGQQQAPAPPQPPSLRKVRGAWEALQLAVGRYTDEARAAADYFQNAAGLMVTHLKTSLIEVREGEDGKGLMEWVDGVGGWRLLLFCYRAGPSVHFRLHSML